MTATTELVPPVPARAPAASWQEIHDLARDAGLAAGLRALQAAVAPGGVPDGPGGHLVVLADAPVAGGARPGELDAVISIQVGDDTVLAGRRRDVLADACRDVLAGRRTDGRDTEPGDAEPGDAASWALGLCWLRLGLSRGLLRRCVEHARGRKVGDESLLHQQLVIGMVADCLTEQLEAEALLGGGADPGPEVLAEVSERLVNADRIAQRLLGASGFQAGLTSHTAWAAELLGDCYHRPQAGGSS